MDGEDDCLGQNGNILFANDAGEAAFDNGDDKDTYDEKKGDLGDMTFCMTSYIKGVMKMMHVMRSHHMLTDVMLEVGSEIFHAHKVILAAASPYFKVIRQI